MSKEGKQFEEDLKKSASDQSIFFYRIKDVNPMFLKANTAVSKNDFDCFIYKKPNLFPVELKSTKAKSVSFSEKIIKKHQIKALENASKYDGLVAGFIFNFRAYDNSTYYVPINEFLKYKYIAENQIKEHTYKAKVNKSSISLDICEEIGIEISNVKKKVRYRYYINSLLEKLINRNGE
ncbi:Holliday junction resolvase RecU [Cytobacillus kochii]|uniref:Holliday junction resolvase RecU n=1 Tax=Cytobacillus kochii TaxID=859143 RepID=UPI001CD54D73|nr:Holliday junction resolvase RecU [Cytobacillus kochii]MCA1027079.1 Holliday junction resolvase RecU [Cytobacillus kochii]